jgi:sugar O-acyltransferase (sialic acid O-acetyltransferase NeuD family)
VSVAIIGYGAGGHARSLLEALRSGGRFDVVALADDDPDRVGSELLGVPVVEGAALERFRAEGVEHAFVGVGGVASSAARREAFARLDAAGFTLPEVVHGSAVVSPWAQLGRGVQLLALVVVNAAAVLGDGAIVNTGAIVEHDCVVGASAHVGPRAVLGGDVTVGEDAHVGMGAVVVEGLRVGSGAFVAAGAVVVGDVADGARVAGVPARPL